MSRIITVVALTVLILLVFLYFPSDTAITNHESTGVSIVAFGDSLVAGTGSTPGNDFVSLVAKGINEPIINMGVPGETSAMGLERIDEVISKNPKLVFVLFGGNDFLRNVPPETTFKNIDQIVIELQDTGAVVVLLGIRGGILTDTYAKQFADIARKRGAIYVPNVLENILGKQQFMSDAIHPNDAGYRIIADSVLTILNENLF